MFIRARFEADYVSAEAEIGIGAAGIGGRLHGDLNFGLQARAVGEVNEGTVESEVADYGLFLESAALLSVADDLNAEMGFATKAGAGGGHVDVDALSAQGHGHALGSGPDRRELLPGIAEKTIDDTIGGVRIVVKENEIFHADFLSNVNALEPGGVSPAFADGGQLFGSVLGIVDENVGTGGELAETPVELRIARLVVCGIDNRADRGLETKAEAALGVVEPASDDTGAIDDEFIVARNFGELAGSRHGAQVHGKVGVGHLRLKDSLQAVAAEEFRTKAIKVEAILRRVQRGKEGNALDVVPVVVANEDVGLEGERGRRFRPATAEDADASAAIEDEASAVGGEKFETGRIAAITPGGTVHSGGRAAYSPKAQLGDILLHHGVWSEQAQPRLGMAPAPRIDRDEKLNCIVGSGSG